MAIRKSTENRVIVVTRSDVNGRVYRHDKYILSPLAVILYRILEQEDALSVTMLATRAHARIGFENITVMWDETVAALETLVQARLVRQRHNGTWSIV